jgi:7-cyano-7-deazaguanine synthase
MARSKKKVGILYSGGLDSAALVAYYLNKGFSVWPVYVKSGLQWESSELRSAIRFLRALNSRRLKKVQVARLNLERAYDFNWSRTGTVPNRRSRDAAVFLPARNLLLTTKAMLILSAVGVFDIATATLKGNPFRDASSSYFRKLADVLSGAFGPRIRIHLPFRESTKSEIIARLRRFPLHLSMSCIDPARGVHCGRCNKCAERQRAFHRAGVTDKTVYLKTFRRSS